MADATVTTVDSGPKKVSRKVVVNAPAAEIFALVANPHRHPELDGSGTVRDTPVKGPDRLSSGAKFSVGMKQFGVPYKITSTVTAFEDNRVVEWQHPLGHKWRWELQETSPTTTTVVETFDYSTAKVPQMITVMGFDKKNGEGISGTLKALAARFA
ncbi:SRPBCC family protein [Williamsia soli]|uniref:SRPBCC family protein n=1 Tax=Williamsia soli TaxID=364929 RepID=UPI001A9E8697|nr:SRPBCC family protein [Williamsia soli]